MNNIESKWNGGDLEFYNKATGETLFVLGVGKTNAFGGSISAESIGVTGDIVTTKGQFIKGSRFQVTYPQVAAADAAKTFFIAPTACKIVSAQERHVTVAGQAGVLTIEKLTAGEAPGAGDDLFATGFDLTSVANTTVSKTAVTTAAGTLASGDALCLKVQSGNVASYALGTITVTMEVV